MDILSDIKEMSEILGKENIDGLINLFEEMNGEPPCVNKKRYRANHPTQIAVLNYLENSAQLIKTETIKTEQFYHLRSYALPLIKTSKAQDLLNLMCEIYRNFSAIYKTRLDEAITKEELLKAIDAPTESILEALSYFKEGHGVWAGWGKGFPYEDGSHINILEAVILRENFLEVLTDYYRWNFINKKEIASHTDKKNEVFPAEIKVEDKRIGRPSLKEKIIDAYARLKNEGKIDHSKTLKSHTELIQKTVQLLFPEVKGTTGMENEAIRRAIGDLFKSDKKTSKPTSKL